MRCAAQLASIWEQGIPQVRKRCLPKRVGYPGVEGEFRALRQEKAIREAHSTRRGFPKPEFGKRVERFQRVFEIAAVVIDPGKPRAHNHVIAQKFVPVLFYDAKPVHRRLLKHGYVVFASEQQLGRKSERSCGRLLVDRAYSFIDRV